MACECGEPDTNGSLGGVEVCHRWLRPSYVGPHRPAPAARSAPPIVISSPDGRRHHPRYRVWRAGVGIEVQLDETGVPVGEGYQFAVLGDNDADVDMLLVEVRSTAEAEIARQYLQRTTDRHRWMVGEDDEVAGRLVWNDEGDNGKRYNVVLDGRTMSWDELGMALEPLRGKASGW